MGSATQYISKNRATVDGKRYVTAFGQLFSVPTDRHVDPALDAVYAPASMNLFQVSADETCAQALLRLQSEAAAVYANRFYR